MDDKLSLSSKNVYDNNGGIKMNYKTGLIGLLTIGAMYFWWMQKQIAANR